VTEKKTPSPGSLLGSIIGGIAGWMIAGYAKFNLWIPAGTAIVLALVFAKTSFKPRHFAGAIAITSGHLAWFVAGSALMGNWSATIFDIVVFAATLAWLWEKPGLGPALTLGIYQGLVLAWNGYSMIAQPFGSDAHRALSVHVLFRALSLAALVVGYAGWKRQMATPAPENLGRA
jgi:hypothetical protein